MTTTEREHHVKLRDVRKCLASGSKTWKQLSTELKMSKPTLSKALIELQKNGEVERVSIIRKVEDKDRSELVYRLTGSSIVGLLEETDSSLFDYNIKKTKDIKKLLPLWLGQDVAQIMHMARKVMDVKNAKELTPEMKQRYYKGWIAGAIEYASNSVEELLNDAIEEGKPYWENVFGNYENDPTRLLKDSAKLSETMETKIQEKHEDHMRKVKSGEIKSISAT
jgi:predicted ArsR family transcriptional regulator